MTLGFPIIACLADVFVSSSPHPPPPPPHSENKKDPPALALGCPWLPRAQLETLCKLLDAEWESYEGTPVIFRLVEILKEDTLEVLGITSVRTYFVYHHLHCCHYHHLHCCCYHHLYCCLRHPYRHRHWQTRLGTSILRLLLYIPFQSIHER